MNKEDWGRERERGRKRRRMRKGRRERERRDWTKERIVMAQESSKKKIFLPYPAFQYFVCLFFSALLTSPGHREIHFQISPSPALFLQSILASALPLCSQELPPGKHSRLLEPGIN